MIDIFNPEAKRCYPVLVFRSNPTELDDLKGRVIGKGCAERRNDWVVAYEKAREVAERYMDRN
jgi:hypothetical protein